MSDHSAQQEIFRLIETFEGKRRVITTTPTLIAYMGSSEGGLFLSQLLYWSDRGRYGDWFYKSFAEWEQELGISKYKVRKYIAYCQERGFLETEVLLSAGSPTTHFRVDLDRFRDSLSRFLVEQEEEQRQRRLQHLPIRAEKPPAAGADGPAPDEHAPTTGQNSPTTGENLPATGQNSPTTGQNLPDTGEDSPATAKTSPVPQQKTDDPGAKNDRRHGTNFDTALAKNDPSITENRSKSKHKDNQQLLQQEDASISDADDLTFSPAQWQEVLDDLRQQLTRAIFEQRLEGCRLLRVAGEVVVLEARTDASAEWINSRLRERVEQAIRTVSGQELLIYVKGPGRSP